jgi:hypothetical protein
MDKLKKGRRLDLKSVDRIFVPGHDYVIKLPDGTEYHGSTTGRYRDIDIHIIFERDKSRGRVTRRR